MSNLQEIFSNLVSFNLSKLKLWFGKVKKLIKLTFSIKFYLAGHQLTFIKFITKVLLIMGVINNFL